MIFLAKMLKIWQFKARDGEETARLGREEFDRYRWEAGASLLCTILDVRAK